MFFLFFFAYDGTQDFQEKDINHIASQMENCSVHAIASVSNIIFCTNSLYKFWSTSHFHKLVETNCNPIMYIHMYFDIL